MQLQVGDKLVQKANRMVEDGNVTRVKNTAYIVLGSQGIFYSVWLADAARVEGRCECPATVQVCSHLLAAAIYHLADPPEPVEKSTKDPFEGLTY